MINKIKIYKIMIKIIILNNKGKKMIKKISKNILINKKEMFNLLIKI